MGEGTRKVGKGTTVCKFEIWLFKGEGGRGWVGGIQGNYAPSTSRSLSTVWMPILDLRDEVFAANIEYLLLLYGVGAADHTSFE